MYGFELHHNVIDIGELKNFIKDLPDEMPVGLVDLTTDDYDDGNYKIESSSLSIEDFVTEPEGETKGKMLIISFKNKLNPAPIG
ncbi:MAG: hypothetical protein ACK50Z_04330 [Betaproteobacteria bacterium]